MKVQKSPADARIRAACPLFACRVCRTKTLYRHQSWCELKDALTPDCRDCAYYHQQKNSCGHPARRKGGETA